MKKIYALFVIGMVLFSSGVFGSSEIHWFSLKEGTEKAKAEKKPMIVDFFYGKGCARCEVLQMGVYDNPVIAKKIKDEFIPIRVDLTKKLTEEEEQLGNKYDFKNDCLLLFMDYQGNVMKDPLGKRLCFADTVEPEWFVQYLDMVKKQQK